MKKHLGLIAILVAASTCISSCATTQPVLTKIDHVVDCTLPAIRSQIPSVISSVATALLAKDFAGALAIIEKQVGDDVVVCAVAESVAGATSRKAETIGAQPNADAIVTNGNAYLSMRGATFYPAKAPASLGGSLACVPACGACQVCRGYPAPVGAPPGTVYACVARTPAPAGCP